MLINSPNISGSLKVTGNTVITGSLTVLGGINATIQGTAATASYVQYTSVANKPALVSGSSQISFTGITNKPTLVSGSGQISFNGITNKPTLVSGSSQISYSGVSGKPAGIVSSSVQVRGYGVFATTGSNQFKNNQVITGSLTVTGQVVAQTLNVQQVTSSIVYSSGSNRFGNSLSNRQQFTGSVSVTGSMAVAGAGTFSSNVTAGNNLLINNLAASKKGYTYQSPASNWGPQVSGLYFTPNNATDAKTTFTLELWNGVGSIITPLTIADTGVATFSSSVTATSFEVGNGQFFKARRSSSNLLLDLLGIESGTDNTRLLITGDFNIKNGSLSTIFNMTTTGATLIQSSTSGAAPQLKLQNPVDSNSSQGAANNLSAGQLLFGATGAFPLTAKIESVYNSDASFGRSADLVFSGTNGSGTLSERMRITSDGEVNIFNNLNLTYSYPRINLTDTNHNSDYSIINADGNFTIYDNTVGANRLAILPTGAATFSSSVTATSGVFSSGTNDNILGGGALGMLNYSAYNSSADQSITLGLGLVEAVNNNAAYRYILGVGGNASGQNLTLSSNRRGSSDLTILTINGTNGAATFGSSVTASSFSTSGFIKSHSTTKTFHVQTTLSERLSNANYFRLQSTLGGGFQVVVYTFSQSTGIGWYGAQVFQAVTIPYFGGWAGDSVAISTLGGQSGVITSAVIGSDGSITFRVSTGDNGTSTQSTINSYIQVSAFQVDGITLTTF